MPALIATWSMTNIMETMESLCRCGVFETMFFIHLVSRRSKFEPSLKIAGALDSSHLG